MGRRISKLMGTAAVAAMSAASSAIAQEPLSENTTNLNQINAVDYYESFGWDYQTGTWTGAPAADSDLGGGAAVAILDGMANELHADLPFNPDPNADPNTESMVFIFTGFPFSPQYNSFSLHGSHVSGIVGARLNGMGSSGVAPKARLLNFAMFDDNGWVGADENQVLTTAVGYGASVANMSYGPVTAGDLASSDTLSAINNHKSEIVVVKSAGNDGTVLGDESMRGKGTPLTNLIIVGSVGSDSQIAWYSNTPGDSCIVQKGKCSVRLQDIFMVAPGGDANVVNGGIESDANGYIGGIWSTGELSANDYYRISGTSMAAPHVAGAVALLHGRWPAFKQDPLATRNILFDTAQDLGDPGTDGTYGRGMLDVYALMNPVGDPTVGIGGGGGGGGNGGNGGPPDGKGNKKNSWPVAQTRLMSSRGLSALTESGVIISMFDDYQRDFPILLSSLVQPTSTRMSDTLERMLTSDDVAAEPAHVQARLGQPAREATPMGFVTSEPNQPDVMTHFNLVGSSAQLFVGHGDAAPVFYQPSAAVGPRGGLDPELSGVNPVFGFASGDFFSGIAVDQGQTWRFSVGLSQNKDEDEFIDSYVDYDARAFAAAVTYSMTETLDFSLMVTQLTENGGLYGARGTGALGLGDSNTTSAATASYDWQVSEGIDVTLSYTMGVTEGGSAGGLLTIDDRIVSDAFHFAVAKRDTLRDRDRFALSVSQPMRVREGTALLTADLALDANGVMQTQVTPVSLAPSGRELDVQAEYALPLGERSKLSTFAFWAMDAGHIKGETDSGLGLRFGQRF